MALAIFLIPIDQEAGGGVEIKLVALLQGAPAILIGLRVEGDCRLGSGGEVIKEDEVGWFIKLFGSDTILGKGKLDVGESKVSFLENFASESILGGFAPFNFASRNTPET